MSRLLRVITFSALGAQSAVDATIRDTVLPRLLEVEALQDAWFGRTGSARDHSRVLTSTWSSATSTPAEDVVALSDPSLQALGGVAIASVEQLSLEIDARYERAEAARVLRVFHGEVKPNELDAYLTEARDGMLADALVNHGLVAFVLGVERPDRFVSASAWTSWEAIAEATGGTIRAPFATRNAARLASFRVVHHEIPPDTPSRR